MHYLPVVGAIGILTSRESSLQRYTDPPLLNSSTKNILYIPLTTHTESFYLSSD